MHKPTLHQVYSFFPGEDGALSRIGWALLAYLLTGILVQAGVLLAAGVWLPWLARDPLFQWLLSVCGSYGVSFPVFVRVLGWGGNFPDRRGEALSPGRLWETYCIALAVLYGGSAAGVVLRGLLGALTGWRGTDPVESILAYPRPLSLLLTVILSPIFEELMFRGMILGRLRRYGDGFAVAASALLFGMVHGNLFQMPYACAVGVVLGWAAVRSGRLWQCILLHAGVNLLSSGVLPLAGRLGMEATVSLGVWLLTCFGVWRLICRRAGLGRLNRSMRSPGWERLIRSPGILAFGVWTVLSCLFYLIP